MAALLLIHADRRFLGSMSRLLARHRVPHAVADHDVAALEVLRDHELVAVITGAQVPRVGGLALLEAARHARPLLGRFLVGPRLPANVEEHVASGLLHGFFPLPLDIGELLGCAGVGLSPEEADVELARFVR